MSAAFPLPTTGKDLDGADGPKGRIGLAQSAGHFPLAHPIDLGTTPGVAALRGYAWNASGFPTTEEGAVALVRSMAQSLVDTGHVRIDGSTLSAMCSLVVVTPDTVHATSDPTGMYPLYLHEGDDGVAISSHAKPLGKIAGGKVDLRGVVHTAAFGYALGARTMFERVVQVPAGASITVDLKSGKVTTVEQDVAYGAVVSYDTANAAADAVWDDYEAGVRELCRVPGTAGMLMSGGFDTRLVAMGFAQQHRPITALTIGDPGNFEAGVAEKVAHLTGARWRRRTAIDDLDAISDRFARVVAEAESANFPTCDLGGEELVSDGATTLSTGYGGETVLGGQGGGLFLGAASRKDRLIKILRRSSSVEGTNDPPTAATIGALVDSVVTFHTGLLRQLSNRVTDELQPVIAAAIDDLGDEIRPELERLLHPGPATVEQLAEHFWYENHVRKHFGRQELTLDVHAPLALPTISTGVFVRASNLDPQAKVDHGVYLRMVRRHWGAYAKIPTSNVPVALDSPAPVIWASRAVRALWDDRQTTIQTRTKGAKGKRFGWSNFEIWARESTLFDQLPRLIDDRIISPAWLDRKLDKQRNWTEKFHSGQEYLLYLTVSGMVGDLLG